MRSPEDHKADKGEVQGTDPPSNGKNNEQKIISLRAVVEGWVNYFHIARAKRVMQNLEGMVRVRLRMGLWKEWKNWEQTSEIHTWVMQANLIAELRTVQFSKECYQELQ